MKDIILEKEISKLMQKVNELETCKKMSLDVFTKKKMLIILLVVIILVASGVLIWGYGFEGFLYIKLKNIVKDSYNQLIIHKNKKYSENNIFDDNGKLEALELIEDLTEIYDKTNPDKQAKFLPIGKSLARLETVTASTPTYVVTDPTFMDSFHNRDDDNVFTNTIWFVFAKINGAYKIDQVIYKLADVKEITQGE